MHNISESIETIGSIIDELSIDEKKIAEFREQYLKILLRSRDTNFYLSTIGDFNSGKSTLINTIIKRKLLKVASAATTAVPTYIYKGKNNRVVVNVKCDNGEKYDLTSKKDVRKFKKEFDIQLPTEIDERISLLTADKELSLKIEEVNIELPDDGLANGRGLRGLLRWIRPQVNIELPDDGLANGLCIIDTPGTNPGADYAAKHEEITKHILNEKADAIIILFPAYKAYTHTFEEFLKDNAEYFMKDAIFVVTKMDTVDEEERDDVIRFVKTNLRNNFHLKDPQVLSCSARLSGKDPYWSDKFKEFEKSLMDKLAQNRQRIVTERLIKLSNELLTSIQSEILSQKVGFENRLTVLHNHSVPNLISVLADSKDAAIDKLSEIWFVHNRAAKSKGTYLENKIMQEVNSGLDACGTRSEVTEYVRNSLVSDIEAACEDIYAISERHTQKLNEALSAANAGMIKKLKKYYGEIGSVLPKSSSLSTSVHQVNITGKLTGLSGKIGDFQDRVDDITIVGLSGLSGLSALILTGLGPIGWIIGGVIGGVAALIGGNRLFVDSARNKARELISEKIPEISKSIVHELCSGMQTNCIKAQEALETKNNELVAQYRPVYETLEGQFNSEKEELTRQIQRSEKTQSRIKTVLQQINQIKGEIAG